MNISIETKHRKWALVFAISVLLPVAFFLLVHFTYPQPLSPSDTIQILTLVVLVIVTAWYAFSTHRINSATSKQAAAITEQARISGEALRVALNAEKNADLPILKIRDSQSVDNIRTEISNLGRGPALNVRIWLEFHSRHLRKDVKSSVGSLHVIGAGENAEWPWANKSELTELPLSCSSSYRVVAEYTDIYGRKFRSTFRRRGPSSGQFDFCRVDEQIENCVEINRSRTSEST